MATAQALIRALAESDRLDVLAHVNSSIWEIIDGGPQIRPHQGETVVHRPGAELVAVNPQPLPPMEIGRRYMLMLARDLVLGSGEDAPRRLMDVIDDWCPTGWPRRIPRPKGFTPEQLASQSLLGGAVVAFALAVHYPDGDETGALFGEAGDKMVEAALGGA